MRKILFVVVLALLVSSLRAASAEKPGTRAVARDWKFSWLTALPPHLRDNATFMS